jgi:hypothetical protein
MTQRGERYTVGPSNRIGCSSPVLLIYGTALLVAGGLLAPLVNQELYEWRTTKNNVTYSTDPPMTWTPGLGYRLSHDDSPGEYLAAFALPFMQKRAPLAR